MTNFKIDAYRNFSLRISPKYSEQPQASYFSNRSRQATTNFTVDARNNYGSKPRLRKKQALITISRLVSDVVSLKM